MRDIATSAETSLGNLYNHFPSKHDVLIEIADLERAELEPFIKQLDKPGPPLKRLDRFITNYAKYLSAPENVILTIEITSEALRKADLASLFLDNRQSLVDALTRLLANGVRSDDFTSQVSPTDMAHMILELIEGRAYHSVLGGPAIRKLLPDLKSFLHNAVGVVEK